MARGNSGSKHWNWKGGVLINPKGYREVVIPEGHPSYGIKRTMLEHRLVVEAHLGRRLGRNELVHHKNHDRLDNRLENLEVMDTRSHTRLHHIGKKASERTKAKLREIHRGTNQGKNHPQYKKHVTKDRLIFLIDLGLTRRKIAWLVDMSEDGLRNRLKQYGIQNRKAKK